MPNPFPYYPQPADRREAQSNVNRAYYELMGARAALAEADLMCDRRAGIAASHDVRAWTAMYEAARARVRGFSVAA